jgi:uncharacterized protein YbbC (DUF1343 family)
LLNVALAFLAVAPVVQVGLERLEAEGAASLRGKRVGLLAHAASVTADGRPAADVLRALGVNVVRLFAAEHGLTSAAAAGEPVAGGRDPRTGLPVVSLYGERRAPRAEDLAGLDAVVVDLQDAGVRFYTYAGTLAEVVRAAPAGFEVVVLDRPNPLGGDRVEGPVADPRAPRGALNAVPGPLVHGLTIGEMARLVQAGEGRGRLTVVAMSGWRRAMTWEETGRAWIAPSPNLRTAEAALAYPGVALLEATNVSEGRGTEMPFLLLGAPWMDAAVVASAAATPGFALEATRFTPRASIAAPHPKHEGLDCAGVRVRVRDAAAARPYALGLRLLAALRRQHGFRWASPDHLDRLLATPGVRGALERGDPPETIAAADAKDIAAWRRERRPSLLY